MPSQLNPDQIAPPFRDIYSHAIRVEPSERQLWLSGQLGILPDGTTPPSFADQCEALMDNMREVLAADGLSFANVIKMNAYVVAGHDLGTFAGVRARHLDGARPAMTTVFVSGLAVPEWLIEVEAVAAL